MQVLIPGTGINKACHFKGVNTMWNCAEKCNLCALLQRDEINFYIKALHSFGAAITLDVYLQSLWWVIHNVLLITVHVFQMGCVCVQLCVLLWKTPVTRQIRQIHCKWKQKSGVSCDTIWSTAYHQIACGATQRFHTDHICSTYDPAAMPYSTVRQPGHKQQGSVLLWKKMSQAEGETQDM